MLATVNIKLIMLSTQVGKNNFYNHSAKIIN